MSADDDTDRADERARMVARQLRARDIDDERVLRACATVPRELFVPPEVAADAYTDRPLPIGLGVTISQPYIVALMTQALDLSPTDRVLEVGTGSGYGAAVLGALAAHVTTIETLTEHADAARRRLRDLGDLGDRVEVVTGDGSLGHPPGAPYDAISVTAAAAEVPAPLLDQLAPGGRLIMPVGERVEELVRITRTAGGDRREVLTRVRFVPLTGRHGR